MIFILVWGSLGSNKHCIWNIGSH